jgi:hypothetical protein
VATQLVHEELERVGRRGSVEGVARVVNGLVGVRAELDPTLLERVDQLVELVAVELERLGELVEDCGVEEAVLLRLLEGCLDCMVVRDRADRKLLSDATRAFCGRTKDATADARPDTRNDAGARTIPAWYKSESCSISSSRSSSPG